MYIFSNAHTPQRRSLTSFCRSRFAPAAISLADNTGRSSMIAIISAVVPSCRQQD